MKLPYSKRGLVPELIVFGVQGTPVVICLNDSQKHFKANVTQTNKIPYSSISSERKRRHLPDPLLSVRGKKEVRKIVNNDFKSDKISDRKPSIPLLNLYHRETRLENNGLKIRSPVKRQTVTFLNSTNNKKKVYKEGSTRNFRARRYLPKHPANLLSGNCNRAHMKSRSNNVLNFHSRKFKFDNIFFLPYGKTCTSKRFFFVG